MSAIQRTAAATADAAAPPTERFVIRVWLPDRPGALGAVASRIGAVGGDVTGIEIVDRGGGCAVDELAVELPAHQLDLTLREIRAVDEVRVESVREIDGPPPDPRLGPLDASLAAFESTDHQLLAESLCEHAQLLVNADWAAVVSTTDGSAVAVSGDSPPLDWLNAYALGAPRLPYPQDPLGGEGEVVCSHLGETGRMLVVGRATTPLRQREAEVIEALTLVFTARWTEL